MGFFLKDPMAMINQSFNGYKFKGTNLGVQNI